MIYASIGTIACLIHALHKKSPISALIGFTNLILIVAAVMDTPLPYIKQSVYWIGMVSPVIAIAVDDYQRTRTVKHNEI